MVDLFLVVIIFVEMVEENGCGLFIGVRRGLLLNRVFFMWDREKKKNVV